MLYLIDQFWPSAFLSSVSVSISSICDRHPSVSRDYGVAIWVIILVQRRVWLESPLPFVLPGLGLFNSDALPQPAA